MKDRRTAIILIGAAAMLAIGAYMLFTKPAEEPPAVRGEVVQPVEEPPTAPDWVNKQSEVAPDYSASEAAPKDVTPEPVVVEDAPEEPQVVEVAEDKMVTLTFMESLADFLLHRFQPTGPKGRPATTASMVALNKYYGRELDGFAVSGDDILAARKTVLDYAFTPAMIDTLYSVYAEPFMVHLVDTARNREREYVVGGEKETRTLTDPEIQAMLRLDGRRIERTADLFRAMGATPAITDMAARYRRAAKAVGRANGQLQDAIAADKDTTAPGERLKAAILQRERSKAEIVGAMKRVCPSCPEGELFYLSQWAYRRVVNGPEDSAKTLESFTKVADILDDLAVRFSNTANQLE